MKNLYKFFIAVFISILLLQTGYSQIPTYTLTAKNFKTNCYNNQLEWDIYLKHSNSPTVFWYVGGQYFFNFDTSVSSGGTLTYEIVGSDFVPNLRPRLPSISVYNGTTVLRLASNICLGLGYCGVDLTNNGNLNDSNGTLVVRVRLTTSTFFSFENIPDFIKWRNYPSSNPVTKINVYIGTFNTEITNSNNHFIDFPMNNLPVVLMTNYPKFYSTGIPHPVTFSWTKYKCNLNKNRYKLEITGSNFILNDSNITDTFKTVTGFIGFRKYNWRVSSYDSVSVRYVSPTPFAEFETGFAMSVEIKCMLEGIYQPASENSSNAFPVKVLLRSSDPPYAIIDSSLQIVNSSDIRIYPSFNLAPSGIYYIVLETNNGIETWSKPGGEQLYVSTQGSYDFTDSISKAYGNNLKLKGNLYCIYIGDVNQDGTIDVNDLGIIDNDAFFSVTGINVPSDLNYDEVVDIEDMSICDNNVFDFISIIRP